MKIGLTPEERASLIRRGVMKINVDMTRVRSFPASKEAESAAPRSPSIPCGMSGDDWIELSPSGRMRMRH